MSRRCLLVLGMHRSGTSALTRVLSLVGAELPKQLMGRGEGNEMGHWEPFELANLHDSLLEQIGSAWYDWRPLNLDTLTSERRAAARSQIASVLYEDFGTAELCVIKEPRICRFAPFFISILEAEAECEVLPVLIIRNPIEVVASIIGRKSVWPPSHDRTDAALLWLVHVLEAEKATRGMRRAVVSYDGLIDDWQGVVETIVDTFSVAWPNAKDQIVEEIDAFLDPARRHHRHTETDVFRDPQIGKWVADTYAAMKQLISDHDSGDAFLTLDRVRAEYMTALPVLEALATKRDEAFALTADAREAAETAAEHVQKLDSEIAESRQQIIEFQDRSQELEEQLSERSRAADTLLLEREDVAHRLTETQRLLQTMENRSEAQLDRIEQLEKQWTSDVSELQQALSTTRFDLAKRTSALEAWEIVADKSSDEIEDELHRARDQVRRAGAVIDKKTEALGGLEALLDDAEHNPEDEEELLQRVQKILKAPDRDNRSLDELLAETQRTINDITLDVERRTEKHDRLEKKVKTLLAALRLSQSQESTLAHALAPWKVRLREAVDEAATQAKAYEHQIAERAKEVERLAAKRSELQAEITGLKMDLDLANRRSEALALDLNRASSSRSTLEAELSASLETVEQLKSELDRARQTEGHAQALKEEREAFNQERVEQETRLNDSLKARSDLENHVRSLTQQLTIAEQSRQSEAVRASQREAEIKKLDHNFTIAKHEMIGLKNEVQAAKKATTLLDEDYQNSTSWRLTAPLRAVKRAQLAVAGFFGAVPFVMRYGGGVLSTGRKAMRVYRREGMSGIRARLSIARESSSMLAQRGRPVVVKASDIDDLDYGFDAVEYPEVSIIIPVYNAVDYTVMCLRSLAAIDRTYTFETIVMDDGSSDLTEQVVSTIKNVGYVRNEYNLGFLRNCNKGASLAKGRYLVFLNNDTELDYQWLTALRRTFEEHGNVGLVGSKLVYPNGRLQEAGGIIWEDGSAWNWGRFQDPAHPMYNYARDVDYVSGASIMVPRDLFEGLNRFDERYEMAYYEDTDLAMSVRAAGMRVLVQPHSIVIHHEGISSGNNESLGVKRYQAINREHFLEKWVDTLKDNLPNAQTPFIASDRTVKGHILIIDACTPTPDQDSGSVDMYNLIRIFTNLGYRVHFIPFTNFAHFGHYTKNLQALGVECVYAPFYRSVDEFLEERGDMFDHVFLTRVNVAAATIDTVKARCPSARLFFYTVDLHFVRETREAEHVDDDGLRRQAAATEQLELGLMDQVNTTIVLSEAERVVLEKRGKTGLVTIPLIRDVPEPTTTPFEEREGVLFIGGYQHTPNIDAVEWLVDEIWPEVRRICDEEDVPRIPLHIYGSKMPERFKSLATDDIHIHGFVEDLREAFSKVRLSVAPLRYGAGLKGKIATSFGYGVPVVGTEIAFEGVDLDAELQSSLVANNGASQLADFLVEVHRTLAKWSDVREHVVELSQKQYNSETIQASVERLFDGE